ncbi:MAG TPA: helix-turn-helix domain-containing protein [Solirubrobacteraceae bacterium]|jgi:DNA-binding transcriptional MerR regulator/quercetin dioxygenase-like cupin family protein|nr:helix-turn-helix domain-containing protein [Solirubrobacteraceae bacterium]
MTQVDRLEPLTISAVADAVGVSAQTLRLWEAQGLLEPDRTAGGQRRYSTRQVARAHQIADMRRRYGWNTAAIRTSLAADPASAKLARKGNRFRRARRERGLTLRDAAARIGISPAYLSALERGEGEPSSHIIARIADAYLIPMSGFAEFSARGSVVVRADERARGVLDGGVTWEELALPGHALEPALLIVPPGQGSGGPYSRPGETFAFVLEGGLEFTLEHGTLEIRPGDSITLDPRTIFAWENRGETQARAIWVEQLQPDAWTASPAATQAVRRARRDDPPGP